MGTTPAKADTDAVSHAFASPQLVAAMSHPTRVHAMGVLLERTASPREIADEIGERLNNVTYHLNQLRKLGCVELVRTERVRGGRVLERFYRATQRFYLDQDAWRALDERQQLDLTTITLRIMSQDISRSMAAGKFFTDGSANLSRTPMVVDAEGWDEVSRLIERTTEELFEVEARVAERTAGSAGADRADIHMKVELMQFRSPRDD